MQFNTWREFFKSDWALACMRRAQSSRHDKYITEEERYQHFKARLMDEVVVDGTWFENGRVEMKTFPLKDKEG